jgi:hypothetical protein
MDQPRAHDDTSRPARGRVEAPPVGKVGGPDTFIRDPAFAAAAAKCFLTRRFGRSVAGIIADHPGECVFCEYDLDYLAGRLDEFNEWAGLKGETNHDPNDPLVRPLRADVEGFMMLPRDEQLNLVRAAQGYGDEPDIDEPDRPSDSYR